MAVVFFLPRVATAEEQRIADMCLIPYERGRLPGELLGIHQAAFDSALFLPLFAERLHRACE